MLLAIPFIWLYNGEKKERKYITNKMFYYFYPIHHVLIYGVALGIKILIK